MDDIVEIIHVTLEHEQLSIKHLLDNRMLFTLCLHFLVHLRMYNNPHRFQYHHRSRRPWFCRDKLNFTEKLTAHSDFFPFRSH